MRKILTVLVALVSLLSTVPLVAPVTNTGTLEASVSVGTKCDVAATGPITFLKGGLNPVPGDTSDTATTTVSEPTGNVASLAVDISGSQWSNTGATKTMPIGATNWGLDSSSPATQLTDGSPSVSIGGTIGPLTNQKVNLNVVIPNSQTADSYSQIITFTVGC
jgi:hypothetical protein